jgi:hypothetical protein
MLEDLKMTGGGPREAQNEVLSETFLPIIRKKME